MTLRKHAPVSEVPRVPPQSPTRPRGSTAVPETPFGLIAAIDPFHLLLTPRSLQ